MPPVGRPILPAPPTIDQSGANRSISSESSNRTTTRRQHTAQACVECKKRKTKCDGQRPCQLCVRKSTECAYVPNEPQSRLEALKREKEELAKSVEQYEAVLNHLRTGPIEKATELLEHLRKAQNLEQMTQLIEHGALLLPNFTEPSSSLRSPVAGQVYSTSEIGSDSTSRNAAKRNFSSIEGIDEEDEEDGKDQYNEDGTTPRKPTDASRPTRTKEHPEVPDDPTMPHSPEKARHGPNKERRVNNIPTRLSLSIIMGPTFNIRYVANASDWTTVTSDSGLVSHLLSAYFTYQHPFFNWIDEELFLEDLASGEHNFCCSVLVNAILACSCHLSDQVQGQAEPWDTKFLGKRFYEEALALWRTEEGKHNLPNLQAAIMLCLVASHNGEDSKGSNFLSYAINSATNLGLMRDVSVWSERPKTDVEVEKWQRSRSVAVWGLFNYSILTSYTMQRAPAFRKPPKVPVPYENGKSMDTLVFRALCSLSCILNDVGLIQWSDENHSSGPGNSVETTERMYMQLLAWEAKLPALLLAEPDGSWAASLLQMQFRYITISLFLPCIDGENLNVEQKFYRERAQSVTATSVAALRHLVHLYTCCHGFAFCPVYMSHILLFAAGTAMDDLCISQSRSEVGATEAYASMLECIVGLGEMCKRYFVAQGALKAIQMRAQERGVRLSNRATRALEVVTHPDWVVKASDHFRSQYPTESTQASKDPDRARLDNMVKKWHGLCVDEKAA